MTDNSRLKASMTVFMGMSMMMIFSVFFSLLEVVHYYSLKKEAAMVTDIGMESLFADYCRPLWEKYGILAVDCGYGGDRPDMDMARVRMQDYLLSNLSAPENSPGGNHLIMTPASCEIDTYGMLTDNNGSAFVRQVKKKVMHGIPDIFLSNITDGAGQLDGLDMSWQQQLEEGEDAVLRAGESDRASDAEELLEEDYDSSDCDDPIEAALDSLAASVLTQVIPEEGLSDRSMSVLNKISSRTLYEGNDNKVITTGMSDKLLFQAYLADKFSCYTDQKQRNGLNYELEYIVGNEESDRENLAETAEKLLAVRGAMNYAAFMSMSEKVAEATILSEIMGGAIFPEAMPAIRSGIIAAWVYTESIMDVRALMAGRKISMFKGREDWTSSLAAVTDCLNRDIKSKNCSRGFDYQTYLGIMLSLSSTKDLSLRAMEVIEDELRSTDHYNNVRLDCFIYSADSTVTYGAAPIFGSLVTVSNGPEGYAFKETGSLNYIE